MKQEPIAGLEGMRGRVNTIRGKISAAAEKAGRLPGGVFLCAACKTQSSEVVRMSAELDIDIFGENRMQEMRAHQEDKAYLGKPCHYIGQLQSNKVRQIVGSADIIQSVDSVRLLELIHQEAEKKSLVQDVLLEVNLGREASKGGFMEEELVPAFEKALTLDRVRLRGLMAIPPFDANEDETRRYFEDLRILQEKLRERYHPAMPLDHLSMGMSDSFEAAIAEGATIVRIGRAIFGERRK